MNDFVELSDKIRLAGYQASPLESMGGWNRITLASSRTPSGFVGSVFWATSIDAKWFLGTYAGTIYQAGCFERLCDISLKLLSDKIGVIKELEQTYCKEFGLVEIKPEEFEAIVEKSKEPSMANFEGGNELSTKECLARVKHDVSDEGLFKYRGEWLDGLLEKRVVEGKEILSFRSGEKLYALSFFDRFTISLETLYLLNTL